VLYLSSVLVKFWKKKPKELSEPNEIDSLIDKGGALYKLGNYNQAIEFFDEVLKIEPNNFFALYNKGLSLSQLGKKEEALFFYDESLKIKPENVLALVNKGLELCYLDKFEEGLSYMDKALEIQPENVYALYQKGATLAELGKYDEAIICYDKALKINPHYIFALRGKGDALSKLGKDVEAKSYYDEILKIAPNFKNWSNERLKKNSMEKGEILCNGMTFSFIIKPQVPEDGRGEIGHYLINESGMLEHFEDSTQKYQDEQDRTVVTIRFLKSKIYSSIDDPFVKEINEYYTKWVIDLVQQTSYTCKLLESGVLVDMPHNQKLAIYNLDNRITPTVYRELKDSILKQQIEAERAPPIISKPEAVKAMKELQKLSEDAPLHSMEQIKQNAKKFPNDKFWQDVKNPEEFDFRGRANSAFLLGEYEKSIEFCNAGLQVNPKSPFLFYMKGRCKGNLGNFKEGIEDLQKAIELRPDFEDAYADLGIIHQNMGLHKEAIVYYDKALQIEPDNVEIFYNKGVALTKLKNYDEAIAYFNEVIKKIPHHVGALVNKGQILSELGNYEKSITCFDMALQIEPDNAVALYDKAIALEKIGKHDQAKFFYDKASQIGQNA